MHKRTLLISSFLAFAAAAHAQVTVVATGLNNPRGLSFGPGGVLYVGEAGLGAGNGAGGVAMGIGLTGSVGEIRDVFSPRPIFTRIVTGLASSASLENGSVDVVGPDGVSALGNGNIQIIMAESTKGILDDDPNANPAIAAQFGRLLQASHGGRWRAVADVGDLDYAWTDQNKDQPWAPKNRDGSDQFPDANPYAVLALPAHQYVVDAASNTVDEVREDGSVRIIAYVPNPMLPFGPNGALVPVSDSVPTCIAQGPDGFLYVGTLAFGANLAAHKPESKVYRFNPNNTQFFLTDADVWASGFHPITGCGFGGGFYVTEFFTNGFGSPGDVVKVAITENGKAGVRTVLGGGKLFAPNGFAAGSDGSIYVSNYSTSPGTSIGGRPVGQVVRIDE